MGESIKCTVGEDRVVEERNPFLDVAIAGDDGRASTMAFEDQFVEIARLLTVESAKPKVIDDQNIRGQQLAPNLLGGEIGRASCRDSV